MRQTKNFLTKKKNFFWDDFFLNSYENLLVRPNRTCLCKNIFQVLLAENSLCNGFGKIVQKKNKKLVQQKDTKKMQK